jgi:hypothetical protein
LYSSAISTQAAVGLAKEDIYIAQLREVLISFGLMDGGNILSDSHAVFDQDCCNTSEMEATIFSHAEKSTGHLAAQLMAGNKVAKDLHYFMCECPYDILPL